LERPALKNRRAKAMVGLYSLGAPVLKMLCACNSEEGGRYLPPSSIAEIGGIVVPPDKKVKVWAMGGTSSGGLGDVFVQVRDGVLGDVKKEVNIGSNLPSYEDGNPLVEFTPREGEVSFTLENKNSSVGYVAYGYVAFTIERV
jgi:hypothetical protein